MYEKGGEILSGEKKLTNIKQHRLYIPPAEIEKFHNRTKAVKTNAIIQKVNKFI